MFKNLHHIGLISRNLVEELAFIQAFSQVLSVRGPIHDETQDVDLCLVELLDGTRIELVSGLKVKNLQSKGVHAYHICFEVDQMEDAASTLVKAGAITVLGPVPAKLFDDRQVAFFMTPVGLVEILEAQK